VQKDCNAVLEDFQVHFQRYKGTKNEYQNLKEEMSVNDHIFQKLEEQCRSVLVILAD